MEAGGNDAQGKVRLWRAEAEAEANLGPPCAGRRRGEGIGAVGRQGGGEIGIGVVGVQASAFVLVVVVEGKLLAGGIGEFEDGIERGIEPAGVDFGDDAVAGAAFEAEDIPAARLVNGGR